MYCVLSLASRVLNYLYYYKKMLESQSLTKQRLRARSRQNGKEANGEKKIYEEKTANKQTTMKKKNKGKIKENFIRNRTPHVLFGTIQLVCEVGLFSYLDFHRYFEVNGPNHIYFLLKVPLPLKFIAKSVS